MEEDVKDYLKEAYQSKDGRTGEEDETDRKNSLRQKGNQEQKKKNG